MNVLLLAERWGCPPWVIHEQPGALRWITRQAELDKALAWKREWDKPKKKT